MIFDFILKGLAAPLRPLRRLAADSAGNTFIFVAAALLPMLALIGGGIDMGRSYLSETRLQQACDSGVLAARKAIGTTVVTTGVIPSNASTIGNRFFNTNFPSGAYGSANRSFTMTLESDYSVSGVAAVDVPTTIMRLFNQLNVPVTVNCTAKLNYSNTDVMMVLDTTGSMNDTNPGDSQPKIAILRQVVKDFYAQLEGNKSPGVRTRYGFLPYSTNVNVGYLLKSGWMVDKWNYEGRTAIDTGATVTVPKYKYTYTYISGSSTAIASYKAATCPGSTTNWTSSNYVVAADGTQSWDATGNGNSYNCVNSDGGMQVDGTSYNQLKYHIVQAPDGTETKAVYKWKYNSVSVDVSAFKDADPNQPYKGGSVTVRMQGDPSPTPDWMTVQFKGCVEERDTYQIGDYGNVNLKKALDLDIDLVPSTNDPSTQWRPVLHDISFLRAITTSGGYWSPNQVVTSDNYVIANAYGLSACPSPARKLAVMSAVDVSNYVDSLVAQGSTYHDIGMIWGGRLISPTGLFAAENADVNGAPTSRNIIFLTDGKTEPLDLSYGTYGVEPLSQRRWSSSSPFNLTQTVENRFTFACNEVKKRNINVWVIGFGTQMTDMLKNCAGDGRWFQANNASQLSDAFSKIAKSMGDLRISK